MLKLHLSKWIIPNGNYIKWLERLKRREILIVFKVGKIEEDL